MIFFRIEGKTFQVYKLTLRGINILLWDELCQNWVFVILCVLCFQGQSFLTFICPPPRALERALS